MINYAQPRAPVERQLQRNWSYLVDKYQWGSARCNLLDNTPLVFIKLNYCGVLKVIEDKFI